MTSHLRPDEQAAEAKIRRAGNINRNVISGATALAGGYAANKILPFLNEYIPVDLAIKGINKVAPAIGKFLSDGMKMGLDVKDGLNFIKDDLEKGKKEPAKENRNIIEQYSPELHQFILGEMQNGRKPIEAAAIAQNDKRFSNVIKKLEKDHKTNWSNIIQSIYGVGEMAQSQQMQQQPQQAQPGQGQQALMQILQKINQRIGGQQ